MKPQLSMITYPNNHMICKIGDPEGSCISICLSNGRMEFAIFDDDGNMLREKIKNIDDYMTMSHPVPASPRQFAMSILDMLDRAYYDQE